MFISNKTRLLIKTNFILSKRLTKRDYFSIFIYILAGINSIAFGFLHLKDGFPVLYVTLVALFHLFIVSHLQMRRGVYINRYQLKLYPLSAHTILHFLWLTEMVDLKIMAFLIPVSICVVSLSLSQGIFFVFVYVIYVFAIYVGFCLIYVIFKLLIKDFIWIDKFHLLISWVLLFLFFRKDFASRWQYNMHDLGFNTLLAVASILILSTIILYLCTYYLISREPSRAVRSEKPS